MRFCALISLERIRQRISLRSCLNNLYSSRSGGTWRIWSKTCPISFICIDPFWMVVHLMSWLIIWLKIKRRVSFGFGFDSPNKYYIWYIYIFFYFHIYVLYFLLLTRKRGIAFDNHFVCHSLDSSTAIVVGLFACGMERILSCPSVTRGRGTMLPVRWCGCSSHFLFSPINWWRNGGVVSMNCFVLSSGWIRKKM